MARRLSEPLERRTETTTHRRASLPRPPFVVPFHYSPPRTSSAQSVLSSPPSSSPARKAVLPRASRERIPKEGASKQKPEPSPPPKRSKPRAPQPRQSKLGPFPTRIPCAKPAPRPQTGIQSIRYTPPSLRKLAANNSSASLALPTPRTNSPTPASRWAVSTAGETPGRVQNVSKPDDLSPTSAFSARHRNLTSTNLGSQLRRAVDATRRKTLSPRLVRAPLASAANVALEHSSGEKAVVEVEVVESVFGLRRVRKVIVPPMSEGSVPSRDPKIVTEIEKLRAQKKVLGRKSY
ncbi:hypothetical protein HMN09_00536700 [Mycena chlorophos]|uniref:Uncharacterized protein n=1 Tax=Mycena chlorophos TaxID=658473 RepID=A0A8H6WIR6_MYCCL|nr:hypothetical protein HMN09_00536700 [Mycena chlorophos]